MPSVGTETITIRVKPSAKAEFKRISEDDCITLSELFDGMISAYKNRGTPREDEYGLSDIPDVLREKGYSDSAVARTIEGIVAQVKSVPRYNARRDSGDWGC